MHVRARIQVTQSQPDPGAARRDIDFTIDFLGIAPRESSKSGVEKHSLTEQQVCQIDGFTIDFVGGDVATDTLLTPHCEAQNG
jgi:hypothetical protein